MKVLNIGRDKDLKIFEEGSALRSRIIEYGKHIEEIHITVFTLKRQGLSVEKISPNIFVHPTNSLSRWFFVFDAISLGKKIVSDNKFVLGDSVITCQDPFECGFVGWSVSKSFGLPLHLQIHTDFLSPYFKTSFFQRLRVFTAKFLLPRARGIRVVSDRISESIKKAKIVLKTDPKILPIRVDVESIQKIQNDISEKSDLKKLFPKYKFIILMASRLTKEKRIEDALKVLSKVIIGHPYVGLCIVGEGPLKHDLVRKCRELNITKNVTFLGWRNDVVTLMKSANMFLSASEYEGYGMSIVEAGLSECPVLTTNVGIASDFLTHNKNSYICPVGDTICMYEGVNKFIQDNAFRYEIAQNLAEDLKSKIPTKEDYSLMYSELLKETAKI